MSIVRSYTDLFGLEMERIFSWVWIFVGRDRQIPKPDGFHCAVQEAGKPPMTHRVEELREVGVKYVIDQCW